MTGTEVAAFICFSGTAGTRHPGFLEIRPCIRGVLYSFVGRYAIDWQTYEIVTSTTEKK